ncbi:MAG: glycosyltransferase family 2 protein [Phycisphaerae bacterium]|nr:glycosyltransferase family 2 protein [Phycisphaerae bacterium]
MHRKSISVIVPVYNSQDSLEALSSRLCGVLEDYSDHYEIVFVNDGSRDASWEVICRLVDSNDKVRGINLMRNYGQHNALLAGIRIAQHGLIVTIDDDLQHPPEEIPKLLEKIDEGYDVVYGAPEEEAHEFSRNIASQITKLAFQSIMKVKVARKISAFRVFRTPLRNAFENFNAPHPSIDVLLSWATPRFSYVNVKHNERQAGTSNYNFGKLFRHAMNMMTGFSTMPLRMASVLGFIFTLFGIGVFLYVFIRYLTQGTPVQGFPFLASVISIFSGVQLFVLGVFGEYLARMYSRVMDRPAYVIDEIKNRNESTKIDDYNV